MDHRYTARCLRCSYTLSDEAYQAAEHLAHQVNDGDDRVHCPACGLRDWEFETEHQAPPGPSEARSAAGPAQPA